MIVREAINENTAVVRSAFGMRQVMHDCIQSSWSSIWVTQSILVPIKSDRSIAASPSHISRPWVFRNGSSKLSYFFHFRWWKNTATIDWLLGRRLLIHGSTFLGGSCIVMNSRGSEKLRLACFLSRLHSRVFYNMYISWISICWHVKSSQVSSGLDAPYKASIMAVCTEPEQLHSFFCVLLILGCMNEASFSFFRFFSVTGNMCVQRLIRFRYSLLVFDHFDR